MAKLFISHSSEDDGFVRDLRMTLADHGQAGWIDSRELRGGELLWPEIERAIEEASAYAVVVSPEALQSKWVGRELRHALEVQKQRGIKKFPVIPLSLNGTKLGVLEQFFGEEPVYISVSSGAGSVDAAMNAILVALGKRLPADVAPTPQPKAEPLEELVLELTDLKFFEQDGIRRASARAQLVYEPATSGQREVTSLQSWRFVSPIGPIEAEDLRWYLEQYATWPSGVSVIQERGRKVEMNLVTWGKLLHDAAMPLAYTSNVINAWMTISDRAGRRFSVYVDTKPVAGATKAEATAAQEAATLLLGLPWELLHNGDNYLFQGAKPTRIRRRLPNTNVLDVSVVSTPIRILLVTARPEDDSCGYIDHRASALPLVEAMESLPGLVKLHVLSPPTLPALCAELDRARDKKTPYHVVHFDGHGVYDPSVGLGGLCFEKPEDSAKLEHRRHVTVFTDDLGPLLRDHRIQLVFLDACQSGKAEKASESVASGLLKVGIASVVAMSHSILVESARRFVEAFYKALAGGKRVGDAMLAGQRCLKDDNFRGRIFGAGELQLEDWFVPMLFQEKSDPQLFTTAPARQTQDDFKAGLSARLGELPPTPETGFVGRSRELLALQRLLRSDEKERYAVVCGQGGEGKTALVAEFARWMVRSHQLRRAAFVSVELYNHAGAVLDALGRQLVRAEYSVATFENPEQAILPVERAIREEPTLLVIDNMESILLPPFLADTASDALSEDAKHELEAILQLCQRLNRNAIVIFTSREALPAPFDAVRNHRPLHQLDRNDAVKLVERTLNAAGGEAGASGDAAQEEIEQLVESVHSHARTLALLAPALQERGVDATRKSLVLLMAEMEKKFPCSREHSLFASVELSLRRMSEVNRERARVLGLFQGGVDLDVLRVMMEWEENDVVSLAAELFETGLATPNPYDHLTLNPALSPYLSEQMEAAEHEALTVRWIEAMGQYAEFLRQQQSQHIVVVATLTLLELPNLFALLDLVQRKEDAEATVNLSTTLYTLLNMLGKPRLLKRIGEVRDAAVATMGNSWNHARFEAMRTRIQQKLGAGRLQESFDGAQALLQHANSAREEAYPEAGYDLAMARLLLARVLNTAGASEQALPLLEEARQKFQAVEKKEPGRGAERMVLACLTNKGDALLHLGRLDGAAAAYEEAIHRDEQLGNERGVAVNKGQLGTVRKDQRRYPEALLAYEEARKLFKQLEEPGSVATIWHQTGMVYRMMDKPEAAEDAYRQSLAIKVQVGDVAGQASTLGQLGNLYNYVLDRLEEAATFYRQAANKHVEVVDAANEGRDRSNLGETLLKLRRLDEARMEILRAIECKSQFGHATEPWKSWTTLADIESDAGNTIAAAEATRKAIDCYLAYRRDGGENHYDDGRIALAVTQQLLAADPTTAASLLKQQIPHFGAAGFGVFIRALQAIATGSRDQTLADAPDLSHTMAAEILLLIETLVTQGL